MGNIKNFNFNKLDLRLSNNDYWDFFLANDENSPSDDIILSGECFVVWYDFNNLNIFPNSATTASTIHSLVTWNGAINNGFTGYTYGLTGIDNGALTFEKDINDPTNNNLVDVLTGSTLILPSGDTRLFMHLVTGTTNNVIYPSEYIIDGQIGNYQKLCGGFYQGYYKIDGSDYSVLPTRVDQAWVAEFWLKPENNCLYTGTTLNDLFPNNKGFFFYMGTRAENKFWNYFEGDDLDCLSGCSATTTACTGTVSTFCTVLKEPNITILGNYGFGIPLSPPRIDIENITNPFLIYGRAYDSRAEKLTGLTDSIITSAITNYSFDSICCDLTSNTGLGTKRICNDEDGIVIAKARQMITDDRNPFLIYGRSHGRNSGCGCCNCTGDDYSQVTVCSYSGNSIDEYYIDYELDIYDNALGFRITDDGRIGYRLMTISGECFTNEFEKRIYYSGISIQEEYSEANIVSEDEWSYITIRFKTNFYDECDKLKGKKRIGKLMFYVNGKLKFTVNNFPEFIARRLDEYKAKQIGVPFNFSLGGGSQGLIESQTFDGLDILDRNLPIEENFGGTFIGRISQFKFNICDLTYSQIQDNYLIDKERYKI